MFATEIDQPVRNAFRTVVALQTITVPQMGLVCRKKTRVLIATHKPGLIVNSTDVGFAKLVIVSTECVANQNALGRVIPVQQVKGLLAMGSVLHSPMAALVTHPVPRIFVMVLAMIAPRRAPPTTIVLRQVIAIWEYVIIRAKLGTVALTILSAKVVFALKMSVAIAIAKGFASLVA